MCLPEFSIWPGSFCTHNALKWTSQDGQKVCFFFVENAVLAFFKMTGPGFYTWAQNPSLIVTHQSPAQELINIIQLSLF